MDAGVFKVGPLGRTLSVDASGRLLATTEPADGLYPFGFGDKGRQVVVDGSGRLVVSLQSARAEVNVPSGQAISITQNVFSAISGESISSNLNFALQPSGALQYTGTTSQKFFMVVSLSLESTLANQNSITAFSKNGTVLDRTRMQRNISSVTDAGSITLNAIESLSQNDIVEVEVTSQNGSPTFTINRLIFSVFSLP
jgi:hypothetical protein